MSSRRERQLGFYISGNSEHVNKLKKEDEKENCSFNVTVFKLKIQKTSVTKQLFRCVEGEKKKTSNPEKSLQNRSLQERHTFFFLILRELFCLPRACLQLFTNKHYARTRVGSIYGSADIERVPSLPNTTLPLTCLPMPWAVLHRTRAMMVGSLLPPPTRVLDGNTMLSWPAPLRKARKPSGSDDSVN